MEPHIFTRAGGGQADFDFYPYNPSAGAGYAFVVIFGIASLIHLVYIGMYRTWFFIPFLLGCLAEAGGYYGRAWAHNNLRLGSPFLLQLFLIIAATPLISASLYMMLSRVTRALDAAEYSFVRISWVSKIYVLIDIACLVLQVMGTVTQAYGGADEQTKAIYLIAGGLIFQLVAFVLFVIFALVIHRRLNASPTKISAFQDLRWQHYFWAIYITSALVVLRNLVRVIEFIQGADGQIMSNEAFLYVFDATPMALVVLTFTILYPGRLIKKTRAIRKSEGRGSGVPLVSRTQYESMG